MNTSKAKNFKNICIEFFESNKPLCNEILAKGDKCMEDAAALAVLMAMAYEKMPKSLAVQFTFTKNSSALFGLSCSFSSDNLLGYKEVQIALDNAGKEISKYMLGLSAAACITNIRAAISETYQSGTSLSPISTVYRIIQRLDNAPYDEFGSIESFEYGNEIDLTEPDDVNDWLSGSHGDVSNVHLSSSFTNKRYPIRMSAKDLTSNNNPEAMELLSQICFVSCSQSIAEGFLTCSLNTIASGQNGKAASKKLASLTPRLLLSAMFASTKILNKLASVFGVTLCEIQFPQYVYSDRVELMERMNTKSFESFENGQRKETHWIAKAEEQKLLITLTKACEYILGLLFKTDISSMNSGQLQELITSNDWQCIGDEFVEFIRLNVTYKKSRLQKLSSIQALKTGLNNQVLGQPKAVESVTLLVNNMLFKSADTHLGVSTFLGPSGVGKTFLAEKLVEEINRVINLGYQCKVINMEQYVEDKDVLKMWGSGSQYVNAEYGELTASVVKYPKQIIVFDEIEKANSMVVQSLLTLIDKGKVKDRTTDREVDFSQCLFVFTTNLGAKTVGQLDEFDVELDLKDLLSNSNQRNSLSGEMVNRLNAGNIVLFNKLNPGHLVQLAQKASDGFIGRSAIDWKNNVLPALVLETLGGDITPRNLKTQAEKLEGTILSKVMDNLGDDNYHKLENITVSSEVVSSPEDIDIVLFSNNKNLCEYVSGKGVQCEPARNVEEINEVMARSADCFIFDDKSIKINAPELATLLDNNIDGPFYLLTSDTKTQLNGLPKSQQLFQHIFATSQRTKKVVTDELNVIASEVQLINDTAERTLRNMKANYTIAIAENEEGIEVVFKDFSYKCTLSQADLLPFITFDGAPKVSFDDVLGLERAKQDFRLVVNAMNNRDYLEKRNTSIAKGCVLAGPPGTGKTMLAKALAAECGVSFFNVNSADLLSGGVVDNINDLFDVVEKNAPAILFFDEIDAIAQCRSKGSELTRIAVNTLLVRLDGFKNTEQPVFVVAATNFPSLLDKALIRSGRLENHIYCDLPSADVRKQYIQRHLSDSNCDINSEQLDVITQITSGGSIAAIARIIRESFYTEIKSEVPWTGDLLIEEVRTARFGGIRNDLTQAKEDIKATAYHEAGHLVAHKLLFPSAKVELASVQPRGAALGMIVPGDSGYTGKTNKQYITNYLQVLLAGFATERMQGFVGESSLSGASDDRQKATNLAKRAIVEMGMSEQFGLAIPSQLSINASDITAEVNKWLSCAFECVTKLLGEHEQLLTNVAQTLIDRETLDANQIEELFADYYSSIEYKLAS